MSSLRKKICTSASLALTAFFITTETATAQTIDADTSTLSDYLVATRNFLDSLIPIVIGLALIGVLWGLAVYAFKAGDRDEQERGRRIMVWGIVTLFVMVSVWGIVVVLQRAVFGPGEEDITTPPDLPTLQE